MKTQEILQLAQTYCNDTITKGRIGFIIDMLNRQVQDISTIISSLEIAIKYTTDTITAGRLQIAMDQLNNGSI